MEPNCFRRVKLISGFIVTAVLLFVSAFNLISFLNSKEHIIKFNPQEYVFDNGAIDCSIEGLSIPKGAYILEVDYYLSGEDAEAGLNIERENGDIIIPLPANTETGAPVYFNFSVEYPVSNGRVSFHFGDDSAFRLNQLKLISNSFIYNDGIVYSILCLFGIICVWILYRKIESISDLAIAAFFAAIFCATTFLFILAEPLPIGTDMRVHMMRIDGLYYGMLEGQFPVIVNPEWNNRYGQLAILYPALFLYPAAALRFMGCSLLCSTKVLMCAVNLVSIILFYISTDVIFEKKSYRVLAVFLMCFEYTRIYGFTSGGKLGGALIAEIFVPLVIMGVIDLFEHEGQKWYYLAFGLGGVFCSHVITAVMCTLFVALMTLFYIKKITKSNVLKGILKSVALFTGLIAGTYIPFLKFYFSGWTSSNLMWRDFVGELPGIEEIFLHNRWAYVFVLFLICSFLVIINKVFRTTSQSRRSINIVPLYSIASLLLWMSTKYFPWIMLRKMEMIRVLTDFLQSGNRFLNIAGVIFAVLITELLSRIFDEGRGKILVYIIVSICGIYCIVQYAVIVKSYMNSRYWVWDEVHEGVYYEFEDYLPAGTITDYYRSDAGVISDDSVVKTLGYNKRGTSVDYSYTADADGEYVEFPMFYYDGYKAYDESGLPVELIKSDRNRIRVNTVKSDAPKEVHIKYSVPLIFGMFYALSIIVWVFLIIYRLSVKRDGSEKWNLQASS